MLKTCLRAYSQPTFGQPLGCWNARGMSFCSVTESRLESEVLKEHDVLKWDNAQEPLSVHTESFYPSLNVPRQQLRPSSALRERRHVWTTPDMTGCLAISIRVNENWEKADCLGLQIGASGVKLQEYANYLNWSGDGFLDNQFDQAADRVTHVALLGHWTGRLRKLVTTH